MFEAYERHDVGSIARRSARRQWASTGSGNRLPCRRGSDVEEIPPRGTMMTLLAFNLPRDSLSEDADEKLMQDTPTLQAQETRRSAGDESDDQARVVKVCKACALSGPANAEHCPKCGGALVAIKRVPDMYLNEIVGGKYRITEKIGQGGMGVVYLAVNDELGQKVAVKFLFKKFADDKNLVLRFLNEAKIYCRVNHPNAVTLLDYGQHDDGALYIITEYIDGGNVTDTLKEIGPMPWETVLDLGLQIAEVLSAAHTQGVIHRDLKPDNIMLMPVSRGRYAVKVLDFGIAKIVDEEDGGPNTETGSVFGTPEFMAPEQARGDEADARSDIYALGVIMFYMATGKLPFRGKNKLVVLNMQLNDAPPRPSEVAEDVNLDPRFEAVIMKCLSKGRAQRYDSADDLLEALEEVRVPTGSTTENLRPAAGARAESTWGSDAIPTTDESLGSEAVPAGAWVDESLEIDRDVITGRAAISSKSTPGLMPVVVGVVLVAILAVGWSLSGGDDAQPVAAPTPDLEQSVDESHHAALIETIELLISEGQIEKARTILDYSPIEGGEERTRLVGRLRGLEAVAHEFDEALASGDCTHAEELAGGVESEGYRAVLEARAKACVRKPEGDDTVDQSTPPAPSPDPAATNTSEPPKQPEVAPKPNKPEPKKPKPPVNEDAPPMQVDPDPPSIEPDPPSSDSADAGAPAQENKTSEAEDGLPPRTMD